MYSVTFTDGHTYQEDDCSILLGRMAKDQFSDEARRNIKRALAWRAWVLSRAPVDEDADDLEFLIAIANAGLCTFTITVDSEEITYGVDQ